MNLFKHKKKFVLKDYQNFDIENRYVYLLEDKNCDDLLESFYDKITKIISENEYFPIIRVADGEYQFLLGKNEFNLRKPFLRLIVHLFKQLRDKILKSNYGASSRTYVSGNYNNSERIDQVYKYADCLEHISNNGILALYTFIKPNFYTEQYLPTLEKYFLKNNISVNIKNYIPFYFVYIILTNKRYNSIYKNKNIHLVTSFDPIKKKAIEDSLLMLNVKSVSWTNISASRSMYDKININEIDSNCDIIFVGAGIGKVNIFNQLRNFPALVIDAGYIFEIWKNPALKEERDYCASHLQ